MNALCPAASRKWVLAATILGSSMAFIDGTVVNVALPTLQTSLNASLADVQWVVEAYALLLSAFLLVGGSLGDHYGRRRIAGRDGDRRRVGRALVVGDPQARVIDT